LLIAAIIAITLALVFYTLGVFLERKAHRLSPFHAVLFLVGLVFDSTGTLLMGRIAREGTREVSGINWHALTGFLAIALMAFHLLWAVVVLWRKDERSQRNFHKFSLLVWVTWLVPYISGVFVGMR